MKKVKTETIGYTEPFKSQIKRGWGCGYAIIPKEHPILVMLATEDSCYSNLQPPNFSQEITLCEILDNGDCRVGFDTAHSWNNETHNEDWVNEKTEELKNCIEAFSKDDAKQWASDFIASWKERLQNYL